MQKEIIKPFVFNDENTINSYGFKIATKGISLKRFKKNPVMLDSHRNDTKGVIGNWKQLKVVGGHLTGVPIFDSDDYQVSEIEGKVSRGFIKSCSMGVSFSREDLKFIDNQLLLTKCELMEVSIVAVPSNQNAVRLYAGDTEDLLTEEEVQSMCLSVLPVEYETITKTKNKMKITLSTAAALSIGLPVGVVEIQETELSAKILELTAKKTAAELQLQSKLDAEETAKLGLINEQVEKAVKTGQISADKKEQFVNLGIANSELLTQTLEAIPAKKNIAGKVVKSQGLEEVKSKEDFQKLSTTEQLDFKMENPEKYKKLFTQN